VNASRLIPKNAYTLDNNSNRLPKISRLVSVQGGPGDIAARSRRTGDEPGPTGSALLVMTIGMVVVAFMAATVPGLDPVTTMSRRAGPEPQQARAAVPARRSVLDGDILASDCSREAIERYPIGRLALPVAARGRAFAVTVTAVQDRSVHDTVFQVPGDLILQL
jgi:hypothetical protein